MIMFFNGNKIPRITKVVLPKEYAPNVKKHSFAARRTFYGLVSGAGATNIGGIIANNGDYNDVTLAALVMGSFFVTLASGVNVFCKYTFSEIQSYKALSEAKNRKDSLVEPWKDWDSLVQQYDGNQRSSQKQLGHS